MDGDRTFQVLGRQNDRAKMVILDEASDLRRYLGTIPAHEQHLPNRPGIVSTHIHRVPAGDEASYNHSVRAYDTTRQYHLPVKILP